jgi:hypothetical protein
MVIEGAEQLSLEDTRGAVSASAKVVKTLVNMRGALCLIGLSDAGPVDGERISDHRGHIEIRNLNLKSIDNTRGTIVIHGGTVAEIRNHRGSVKLLDGAKVLSMVDVSPEAQPSPTP